MKIKTIQSYWSTAALDEKVNDFLLYLENNNYEVLEVQSVATIFVYQATIIYH